MVASSRPWTRRSCSPARLTAAEYFDGSGAEEVEIRRLANSLYRAADWAWALAGGRIVRQGWTPEGGFLPFGWQGYNEALLLYVLALGSPDFPLPAESYAAWTATYEWRKIYGIEFLLRRTALHAPALPPLDRLPGNPRRLHARKRDRLLREQPPRDSRAAAVRRSAIPVDSGVTRATSGGSPRATAPGRRFAGSEGASRRFLRLLRAGRSAGPDDGTLSPWAVIASLPFAPETVLPTFASYVEKYPDMRSDYGFLCSLNPTFGAGGRSRGHWIARGYYGLDQGPVVLMIENFATGMTWDLMRRCRPLVDGLKRAGFVGGWLET